MNSTTLTQMHSLPFCAVLRTLQAGRDSHIFPFKQPYFYTNVYILLYPLDMNSVV